MVNHSSDNTRNPADPATAPAKPRLRLFHLYRHPENGWTVISQELQLQIMNRRTALPYLANLTIKSASVYVRHREEDGELLARIEHGQWFLDAAGLLDEERMTAAIAEAMNHDDSAPTTRRLADHAEDAAVMAALRAARPRLFEARPTVTAPTTPSSHSAPTRAPTVAEFLANVIEASHKSQTEISEICGFARPHMVSMMKTGKTSLPFDKIQPLARALGIDPLPLFKLALAEYRPDLFALFEQMVDREVSARLGD